MSRSSNRPPVGRRTAGGWFPALLMVLALDAGPLGSGPAQASRHGLDCDETGYDHNGSVMSVVQCLGSLEIRYDVPREGLASLGVREGTLLLDAAIIYDGTAQLIEGTAYTFKRGCTPMGFPVEGWLVMPAGPTGFRDINFRGRAPKRGDDCRVHEWREERLEFTPIGAFMGGPEDMNEEQRRIDEQLRRKRGERAKVEFPDLPDGVDPDKHFRPAVGHWSDAYRVEGPEGVAAPIRSAPGHDAPTIGRLPTGSTGIAVFGCTGVPDASGWEAMTPSQRNAALTRGWCEASAAEGTMGHVRGGNLEVTAR